MVIPTTRAGKITVAILAVFTVAMNPPVIGIVSSPTLIAGMASLYAWTVFWGVLISIVLIWAAWRDAFALAEDQVPPELRDDEHVSTTRSNTRESHTGGGD